MSSTVPLLFLMFSMFVIVAALMEPFSRGAVSLVSDDPAIDPRVDFRLLSDPRDLARMRIVARETTALLASDSVAKLSRRVSVGPEDVELALPETDPELDHWLLANVSDYVHACGTCKMGAPGDSESVVDSSLAVVGVDGLLVADASVVPVIPRANTHLTAVMIGERAAALLSQQPD